MGGKMDSNIQQKGMNTAWPEDARPNPYLSEEFENFNERMTATKKIDAHPKGIGGLTLHAKK